MTLSKAVPCLTSVLVSFTRQFLLYSLQINSSYNPTSKNPNHPFNANILRPQVGSAEGGSRKVFVIDEIGKMELFSQPFIRAVRQTLDSSSCTVLGTIPIPKGKPLGLVEEVRSRRDVKIFTVSKNSNAL